MPKNTKTETVDVVVIGGGAAGLNGALMLARSRRSVVVIDSGTPRNAPAEGVHGLLGLEGVAPGELLRRGREEVRGYGGTVVTGEVTSAVPDLSAVPDPSAVPGLSAVPDPSAVPGLSAVPDPSAVPDLSAVPDPSAGGDPRFTLTLSDGSTWRARRLLVATGLRDVLPDVPGLAQHWGRGVVHCPYCHGWEVRDEPIGVLAVGPVSVHHALLFRQLTDDLVYFTNSTDLDGETRARFAARDIRVVDAPVAAVESASDGTIAGVRLTDGEIVNRGVLAVATTLWARTEGLAGLNLPMEDLPGGMGRHFVADVAGGGTQVRGVWVAGNAADPMAQVGASAAAGALAGARINADLVMADTDAALAASRPDGVVASAS